MNAAILHTVATQLVATQVEAVTLLVQNNADDDAILAFLRSLGAEDVEHYEREAARLREELAASEAERYAAVAHLKEELADKTLRLQEAMADYLYVQGLFNLCGLMGENGGLG